MNKFVFGVLAVTLGVVAAGISDEEVNALKNALRPIIEGCGKDFELTWDTILAHAEAKTTDKLDPCFHACVFKKIGILNEEGLFAPEVGLDKKKEYVKNTEDSNNIEASFRSCATVNDAEVTDGAKGCERAKMLHACLKEKLPILPL